MAGSGLAGAIVEAADIQVSLLLGQELKLAGLVAAGGPQSLIEPGEVDGPLLNLFPSAPCPGSARRGETYRDRAPRVNTRKIILSAKSRCFVGAPQSPSSKAGRRGRHEAGPAAAKQNPIPRPDISKRAATSSKADPGSGP